MEINYTSYFTMDFLIYVGRWIASAFIMMIPLYIINNYIKFSSNIYNKYKEYFDLVLVQIVGAFIFWYIDQYIFKT